jgi:hypothetical protein
MALDQTTETSSLSLAQPSENRSPFNQAPADLAARARRRMEAFANAQAKLLQNVQETNRQWLNRVQAEANLATEFASKLSAARSVPDTLTAYRHWVECRFEMMAADTQHLANNAQKFMHAGAHLFKDNSLSGEKINSARVGD